MARSRNISSSFSLSLILIMSCVLSLANAQGLKVGYYSKSCPSVEAIVTETVNDALAVDPSLSGALLRLFFHDCFVRGCDGSILLNSPTHQAEKDAPPNLTLRGYDIIDRVKTAVEKKCTGVVSCADIVALVARDVTFATKGKYFSVETGRRDGNVSNFIDALTNLIPPTANITTLKTSFAQKGLSVKDLVVLSGGHTIGTSHCSSFSNRLYNFTGKGDSDPSLNPNYVKILKAKCKPGDQNTTIGMDETSRIFDTNYYALVAKRRGLFDSDAALLNDPETKAYVQLQHNPKGSSFSDDFGKSMVNMGRIGILTGENGEVRKICSKVN